MISISEWSFPVSREYASENISSKIGNGWGCLLSILWTDSWVEIRIRRLWSSASIWDASCVQLFRSLTYEPVTVLIWFCLFFANLISVIPWLLGDPKGDFMWKHICWRCFPLQASALIPEWQYPIKPRVEVSSKLSPPSNGEVHTWFLGMRSQACQKPEQPTPSTVCTAYHGGWVLFKRS